MIKLTLISFFLNESIFDKMTELAHSVSPMVNADAIRDRTIKNLSSSAAWIIIKINQMLIRVLHPTSRIRE